MNSSSEVTAPANSITTEQDFTNIPLPDDAALLNEMPDPTKDVSSQDNMTEKTPDTKLAQTTTSTDEQSTVDGSLIQDFSSSSMASSVSSESSNMLTSSTGGSFSSVKMIPQVNSGTATTSIPIEVPPGRNDIAPKLALNYNSDKSNGWLGVGWMLDVGAIQRETKWGLDYTTNDFVFTVNGSSTKLVRRDDLYHGGGSYDYEAETEGDFLRYYYSLQTNSWVVTAKDGTKYYFGTSLASRQNDPNNSQRIFKWCLDKVVDANGNYMEFHYAKNQGEIYLDEIKYTGNAGLLPSNSVKFYTESRTDSYEVYTTHFSVKTAKRLKTIEVYGNGQLARKYEINYSYSPSTYRTLLDSVTLYGTQGGVLPSVSFTYSEMVPGFNNEIEWYLPDSELNNGYNYFGIAYLSGTRLGSIFNPANIADLNGDALPERISNGFYGEDRISTDKISYDMNGDGMPDMIYSPSPSSNYLTVSMKTGNGYLSSIHWNAPNSDITDFFDMDGDGLPDKVTTGGADYLNVYLNTSSGFSDNAIQWHTPITNPVWGQPVNDDMKRTIIDMNGDGLPDRVTSNSSMSGDYLMVYLNIGSGFSYNAIQWHTPIVNSTWNQDVRSGAGGSYQNILDMNGDGLPDRVTTNANKDGDYLMVFLNTGSGFSDNAIQWHTPNISPEMNIRTTQSTYNIISQDIRDMNGDGLPDRVNNIVAPEAEDHLNVYTSDGPFPDLLKTINNGLGGTTEIQYTPSTQYDNTYLPFVKQVVSTVIVSDGKGNSSTTTFDYANGLYDSEDKEFRGFGYVKSTDPIGTTTETWFKQDDIYRGLMEKQTIKDSSGNKYSEVINTHNSVSPYTGVDFPYLQQEDNYEYDGTPDARHSQTSFEYDEYGNMTRKYSHGDVTIAEDDKDENITYYYDIPNWIVSLSEHNSIKNYQGTLTAQTWYTYYQNGTGNLWTKTEWNNLDPTNNPVTVYAQYDSYGNVTEITDPRGFSTFITYDTETHTYPVTVQNTLGHTIHKTYDYRFGKVITVTDPNGNTTSYGYDEFGRLKTVTSPSPYGRVEYLYQNYGDPYTQNVREEARDELGALIQWKERYFDGLGRTTKGKSGGPGAVNIVVDTTYNSKGLEFTTSNPYFQSDTVYNTTYHYDPVDRLTQTLNPDGTSSSISYDKGRVTYVDANGHKKVAEKDVFDRIVKIEEYYGVNPSYALYATTRYEYDVLNNLTKVIDAHNNMTTMVYDSLSRKREMIDPDMGHWYYNYDKNGNLVYQKDAKLQEIIFEYDEINRLSRKIYPDYTFIEYTYDEPFSTNPIGRLTTVTEADGIDSTKFYYDVAGQISRTEKVINNSTPYITETQYDALGRLAKIIYPDTTEVDYTYNGNGNIHEIISGMQAYVTYDSYNAIGNPLSITFGNGVSTVYQYYPQNNRLFSITTNSGSTGLMNLAYYYDSVGNITSITDILNPQKTRTYKYDDLDRLIEADSPSYSGKLLYQYDKIGNMTYNCKYGYYQYDDPDHVHAVTSILKNGMPAEIYVYDDNGNMTEGGGRTLTYDYNNMPVSIVNNDKATVSKYDAFGNRVLKMIPSEYQNITRYIGEIYDCKDGDTCNKYLFSGTQRMVNIKGTETNYYHTDHLQSSNIITDASGANVEEVFYYPYGEIQSQTGSVNLKHKYTGKEYDAETGLYYYGARYYDPKLARFISADTIVPEPYNPQSLNRYSYAINNPIVLRDLDGHCFWSSVGSAVRSFFSGVARAVVSVARAVVGAIASGTRAAVGATGRALAAGARALASGAAKVATVVGGAIASAFGGGGSNKDLSSISKNDASQLTGKDCDTYRELYTEKELGIEQWQKDGPKQKDYPTDNKIDPQTLERINNLCKSNNQFEGLRQSWDSDKTANLTYRWGTLHIRVYGETTMFHYDHFNITINPVLHGIVDLGGYHLKKLLGVN
ncbi:MAG: toxin TcdB middle/N-terminal domain-containing protein [Thermodesulfovibrionia bacterium]|nr:toxin TcdB middle/N-terminal domain-containing protein [Thermodesulfovibrionia bacterium]